MIERLENDWQKKVLVISNKDKITLFQNTTPKKKHKTNERDIL